MTEIFKGYTQASSVATVEQIDALNEARARKNAGPAGGLLIAVGTSLLLWAVLAEAAKLASALLF